VESRCNPLILLRPLLKAVTGAAGAVLGDVVRGDAGHPTLKRVVSAEIAVVWGFLPSMFLTFRPTSTV
jgi:hypothetical protein